MRALLAPNLLPPGLTSALLIPALMATCNVARAQCQNQWLASNALPGVYGSVYATTTVDPDGPGPAPELLVVAGTFPSAGSTPAANIALHDPSANEWFPLGSGIQGTVAALATAANGDVFAAGQFATAGGMPAANIARWDGSSWHALGSGLNYPVYELLVTSTGDLIAAGAFTVAGGVAAKKIARWDGSAWSAIGAGFQGPPGGNSVSSLAEMPNGYLLASGSFTGSGGAAIAGFARWDGSTWSEFANGTPGAQITSLDVRPNGHVVASGFQLGSLLTTWIGEWDGSSWAHHSWQNFQRYEHVAITTNGDLIVTGQFSRIGIHNVQADNVARWDGSTWTPLGAGTTYRTYTSLTRASGEIVVGGSFASAGGIAARGVATWDGQTWNALGAAGQGDAYSALLTRQNGDVVAGGHGALRQFDGTTWTSMGLTFGNLDRVLALTEFQGDLIAAGNLTQLGQGASPVMRFDGTTWTPLAPALSDTAYSMCRTANGDLLVGGAFQMAGNIQVHSIARFDGSTWSALGGGMVNNDYVHAIAELPDGDIVAGIGSPAAARRWDGSQWTSMGLTGSVTCLHVHSDGTLYAGGAFLVHGSNSIARWNGSSWQALANGVTVNGAPGSVASIVELPDGDLLVSGSFDAAGGQPADNVARWNGSSWSTVAGGTNGAVGPATVLRDGDVMVSGLFSTTGTVANDRLARLTTTCPASALTFGSGCASSVAPLELRALTLPWTGSVSRALATGMAPNSLAVGVRGLGPASIPLQSVLPQALPGCQLLATNAQLDLYVPQSGQVETAFAIPDLPVLAGFVVYQQVVALELDGNGAIFEVSSTNAVQQTIGSF